MYNFHKKYEQHQKRKPLELDLKAFWKSTEEAYFQKSRSTANLRELDSSSLQSSQSILGIIDHTSQKLIHNSALSGNTNFYNYLLLLQARGRLLFMVWISFYEREEYMLYIYIYICIVRCILYSYIARQHCFTNITVFVGLYISKHIEHLCSTISYPSNFNIKFIYIMEIYAYIYFPKFIYICI